METKSSSDIQLPPGFRFHPSDEELLVHYLKNKVTSSPLPAAVVAEIDLYKYDPWELPRKAIFGEDEWYFFTPRDRKYPNGARPNRAACSGYWKATGTDKPVFSSCGTKNIGVKKSLVFYRGRPPRGIKTDWIMHEYRLHEADTNPKRKGSTRLDDWVLCRVRQKSILLNPWENRNGLVREQPSYLAKVNEILQTNHNRDAKVEMIRQDFPMLPYIFASQGFPCNIGTVSDLSFPSSDDKYCTYDQDGSSDKIFRSPVTSFENLFPVEMVQTVSDLGFPSSYDKYCTYDQDDSSDKIFQSRVTSFENLFSSAKRKLEATNDQQENCLQPSKKPIKCNDVDEQEHEDLFISISDDGTGVNLCGTEQSGGINFSAAQCNSFLHY